MVLGQIIIVTDPRSTSRTIRYNQTFFSFFFFLSSNVYAK